ncbi:MAG TPA: DinB family protein [Gemmatimonadales bacterium]|nr:DinB family protein [Gemmatimonadales bacterium]
MLLHPELEAVRAEFVSAQDRLQRLAEAVPETAWNRRPDPGRWSIAECVGHLNLTAMAYLPLLGDALARARRIPGPAPKRYRRDPIGWILWRTQGPPVRHRLKTIAAFVPGANQRPAELLAEFERLQDAQLSCVREADGLRLGQVWIRSPFDPRIRYNIYSCLSILARHQHRHLWQAEQVWARISDESHRARANGRFPD